MRNRVNANKICLNARKTEVVLLKSSKKETDSDLYLKLNGKQPYSKNLVKHLGIKIDKKLTWCHQINNVATKLNRENAMLIKRKHFINFNTPKFIYDANFESYLNYSMVI